MFDCFWKWVAGKVSPHLPRDDNFPNEPVRDFAASVAEPITDGDDIPSEEELDAAQAKMGDKGFRSLVYSERYSIDLRQRRDRIGGREIHCGLKRRAREIAEKAASSSVGEWNPYDLF